MNKQEVIRYLTNVAEYSLYPTYTDKRDPDKKKVALENYNTMHDVINWLENEIEVDEEQLVSSYYAGTNPND